MKLKVGDFVIPKKTKKLPGWTKKYIKWPIKIIEVSAKPYKYYYTLEIFNFGATTSHPEQYTDFFIEDNFIKVNKETSSVLFGET